MSGEAKDFLVDVVMAEVSRMDNENLVFRGNTFATKAVDTYMKMVGEKVGLHVHVCVAVGWQGVGHPMGGRGWGTYVRTVHAYVCTYVHMYVRM